MSSFSRNVASLDVDGQVDAFFNDLVPVNPSSIPPPPPSPQNTLSFPGDVTDASRKMAAASCSGGHPIRLKSLPSKPTPPQNILNWSSMNPPPVFTKIPYHTERDEVRLKAIHEKLRAYYLLKGNPHFAVKMDYGSESLFYLFLRNEKMLPIEDEIGSHFKNHYHTWPAQQIIRLYGLHQPSSYDTFQPDIMDIVTLIDMSEHYETIMKADAIFVTTVPDPCYRFDPSQIYDEESKCFRGETILHLYYAPTKNNAIVDIPDYKTRDLSRLKAIYDKLKVFRFSSEYNEPNTEGVPKVIEKIAFQNVSQSYIWVSSEKVGQDEIDAYFKSHFKHWPAHQIKTLLGYHTYGGYYGFFRPDIMEVLTLIDMSEDREEIMKADAIFVTTSSYPSPHISDCYNVKIDKHRGQTHLYLYFKHQLFTPIHKNLIEIPDYNFRNLAKLKEIYDKIRAFRLPTISPGGSPGLYKKVSFEDAAQSFINLDLEKYFHSNRKESQDEADDHFLRYFDDWPETQRKVLHGYCMCDGKEDFHLTWMDVLTLIEVSKDYEDIMKADVIFLYYVSETPKGTIGVPTVRLFLYSDATMEEICKKTLAPISSRELDMFHQAGSSSTSSPFSSSSSSSSSS